ncbi:MAG: EamA family transporter [Alphaproteobacteria bacterium]
MSPVHILLALLVPAVWGLGFALAKLGMDQFPPFLIMSMRFAISALVLVWFVKPPWGHMRMIFLIAMVSATIQYGFTFYGLRSLDASTAVIVVQLEAPFLALLGAVFLKERLGWKKVSGMVLAFGGVGLIAGEPRLDGSLLYVGMVCAGALTWAIGQLMIRQLKEVSGLAMLAWVSVFAAPQMFVASMLVESGQLQAISQASIEQWGIVLYLGLIMTAIGYLAWYTLVKSVPFSSIAPFLLLTPVTTLCFGYFVIGDVFTVAMAAGSAMVLAGIAITTIQRRTALPLASD